MAQSELASLEHVALQLRNAYSTGPIPPIRESFVHGAGDAYVVQSLNTEYWQRAGRRLIGRKIGATSEAVQRQLGITQPDFGALFADMCLVDGEPITPAMVIQPRVEAEVAVVLGSDLPVDNITITDLVRAIDHLMPAIEIVDSRILGWQISDLDTIADNASSGVFLLGTRPLRPRDIELRDVRMSLSIDGREVSRGLGSDCLGHPYLAALWLARRLGMEGGQLRAGDIVLTGALGPVVPLPPGGVISASLRGMGSLSTRFDAD